MSWVIVGVAGGSAALSLMNQQQQKEQRKQEMLSNAAQQQFSPWTGMKSDMKGYSGTGTETGAIAQGALSGAMMGSQFKAAPAAPVAPGAAPAAAGAGSVAPQETMDPNAPGNPWQKQRFAMRSPGIN